MITFGTEHTSIVKGVAILFMMILHCLGGSEWYDEDFGILTDDRVTRFFSTFKICVPMFAFMIGYGYAFAKNKNLKYSWEHICRLLKPFWIVLFVFTIPFVNNIGGGNLLLKNMFGLKSFLNYFSWFVYLFIYAMVVMPLVTRLFDRRFWYAIVIIVCSYICEFVIHSVPNYSDNDYLQALFNCFLNTPCIIVGYLFAKSRIFERIRLPRQKARATVLVLLCGVFAFVIRYLKPAILGFDLGVIYAPMMIFSIVAMFNLYEMKGLSKMLQKLGELSVYMWFLHALFFTKAVRHVYQPMILVSDNVFVVAAWTILLTTIAAFVLKSAVDRLENVTRQ